MAPKETPLPKCRVCGSDECVFLCSTPWEPEQPLLHYRCKSCGSVFIGNHLDNSDLAAAYSKLDTEAYYRVIEKENRRKMDSAVTYLKAVLPTHANLLDIGCGPGLFMGLLYDNGFTNVSGHEIPLPEGGGAMDLEGKAAFYHDYDYSTLPSAYFDAVTLLDVAEHVPVPRLLFDACARVLKPGGLIYLHTPTVSRMDRIMHVVSRLPVIAGIGRTWQSGRTSVFHLENCTPTALKLLLEGSGFGDIHIMLRNELSWPIHAYVRVYLIEKHSLPEWLTPLLVPFFYPLLRSSFFNTNKAVLSARSCGANP